MSTYTTKAPSSAALKEITKDRNDGRKFVLKAVRAAGSGQFKFTTKSGRVYKVTTGALKEKTA